MFTRKLFIQKILATILILLYLPAVVLASPVQAGTPQADFSAVDAYVEAQREALGIPGMAVAIVQGDQVAYLGSYGEAGKDRPVTPQTPFQIGSLTKSFTALAVMQLVEAGKVELDTPVQTYIPWFRTADETASAQITVRHLLNQTSGFSTSAGRDEFAASDLSDQAIENSVRILADVALVHTPGTEYEYSNVNYNILGYIVQVVSGQSYESYMQENVFGPLEMRHSFTSQTLAVQDGLSTGYVTFLGFPVARETPFNCGNLPNGYQFSSAEDLAHHLIAQLNEGRYGDTSVVSPQGMTAMHEPAAPMGTLGEYYAMAWKIGDSEGTPVIYHSGDNANFATHILMVPQEKLGVAVLINVNGYGVNSAPTQIADGVMAILRGAQPNPYQKYQQVYLAEGSGIVPALIALLWIGWMAFRFVRRQKRPAPARRGFAFWTWVIVVPVLVDIVLLGILLLGIPTLWELPLNGIAQMFPDYFILIAGSALALAVWGVLRTVLTLRQPGAM